MAPRYRAYGLVFESELELPEFLGVDDGDAVPDVQIRVGAVPEHLEEPSGRGVLFEAGPDEFLLRMSNVANYWVRNGNEIVVEPSAAITEHEVRVFLLGSGIGALLHQREMLVLHAAAIGNDHGAVLFAGTSGIGKSTLLGELLRRGHPMMVDDVCAVVSDGERGVEVLPGYPRTRLWADSAKKLDIDTAALERTRPSLEKFERQVPDLFWDSPAPMRRLYILTSHNDATMTIKALPAVRSFAVVLHNTYRRAFMDGLAMRKPHFELATTVASSVPIVRVTRPSGTFELAELADLIESDLAGG